MASVRSCGRHHLSDRLGKLGTVSISTSAKVLQHRFALRGGITFAGGNVLLQTCNGSVDLRRLLHESRLFGCFRARSNGGIKRGEAILRPGEIFAVSRKRRGRGKRD